MKANLAIILEGLALFFSGRAEIRESTQFGLSSFRFERRK